MTTSSVTLIRPQASLTRWRAAATRVMPEALAVPPERLRAVNADVGAVVCLITGVLPGLRALAPSLQEELRKFEPRVFDRLELLKDALMEAHTQTLAAQGPPAVLPALAKAGFDLRARLIVDIQALAAHGLVDARPIRRLSRPAGYLRLAFDLQVLAVLLRERWSNVAGKTGATERDLEQAEQLADALLQGLSEKGRKRSDLDEARAVRERVFTLLVETYEEVRHAVLYVRRHEGDGARRAPPLAGMHKRPGKRVRSKGRAPVDATAPAST